MGVVGWAFGPVAIGIVATMVFLLQRILVDVAAGRSPKPRPKVLLFYVGGLLLGLALFAASIVIGFEAR